MKKLLIIAAILILGGVGAYFAFKGESAPTPNAEGKIEYRSEDAGIAFEYKDIYMLESREDAYAGQEVTVITIIDRDVVIPEMSEGPVSIAVLVIENQEGPLEAWIRNSSISNFQLSMDERLTPTTVAGEEALAYTHSGLYENDAVAVMRDGKVYLFVVSWIDAESPMRADFAELLESVSFL